MVPTSNSLNSSKLKIKIFISFGYYGKEQKERKTVGEICKNCLLVILDMIFFCLIFDGFLEQCGEHQLPGLGWAEQYAPPPGGRIQQP
jgi:hypothetical protein